VKFGPYLELRPNALRKFLKEHLNFVADYKKIRDEGAKSLEELCFFQKISYFLNTPPVLFSLILEGAIDEKTARQLWQFAQEHTVNTVNKKLFDGIKDLVAVVLACREHVESIPELQTLIATKGINAALDRGREIAKR
jgi:hypothetical protein